jgi:uncharacterized protein YcbK (DUF882 family)
MGDLSKHFNRSEFACKCGCGFDTVDYGLLDTLEYIREWFAEPVTINSACRCIAHNKAVGGSDNSQHLKGKAADIVVRDNSPTRVLHACNMRSGLGVGVYDTFTHIDSRGTDARW